MAFGASLSFEAVFIGAVVAAINLNCALVAMVVGAGKTLRRRRRCTHWSIALASDHIAITTERLLVEGGDFFLRIHGGIGDGTYAQLPFTETKMDVCGLVFIVVGDDLGARIDGEPEVGCRSLVGVDMYGAECDIQP